MTNIVVLLLSLLAVTWMPETVVAKPYACHYFGYGNAEKLLGPKLTTVDSEEGKEDGSHRWNCTFTSENGEGKIFFALFKDVTDEAARAEFQRIRESNKNHTGFEDWSGVGDEAIVHTDGKSFQFLMVRKGAVSFRIKMNPIKGTPVEDVKRIAAALSEKLK